MPYTEPGKAGFLQGNPGRPKGSPDKRRISGAIVAAGLLNLPKVQARVQALLESTDTDPRVFVSLWTFLHEQVHGKATQRVELDLEALARPFAAEAGVSTEELLATAERMVIGAPN